MNKMYMKIHEKCTRHQPIKIQEVIKGITSLLHIAICPSPPIERGVMWGEYVIHEIYLYQLRYTVFSKFKRLNISPWRRQKGNRIWSFHTTNRLIPIVPIIPVILPIAECRSISMSKLHTWSRRFDDVPTRGNFLWTLIFNSYLQ
jgi:hypothetical protein